MMKTPKKITRAKLDVIVMPNGEVLCIGNTIGWVATLGKFLTEIDELGQPVKAKRS